MSAHSTLSGLGHPILGPSAIDAISAGSMFIDPIYQDPRENNRRKCFKAKNGNCYDDQHFYAAKYIGKPYVCTYLERNIADLKRCISLALNTTLLPFIPEDFQKHNYIDRVKTIFSL